MVSGAWAKLGSANALWVRCYASSFAVSILLSPPAFAVLPISIRNEADVAVENGRRHLEAVQQEDGFWTMDGRTTVLPAFAFLGTDGETPPAPLAAAARAAIARLARYKPPSTSGDVAFSLSPKPSSASRDVAPLLFDTPPSVRGDVAERQGGVSLAEDTLILAATLSLYNPDALGASPSPRGLLAAARTRLLRLDSATQPPSSAWLARCALDLIPGRPEQPADWAPLFSRRLSAIKDCAIAGYARIRHGVGAAPPAAILAHLRWLRAHSGDLLSNLPPSARGDVAEQQGTVYPEDLYFSAVFLDASPPALVATAGIPADWRSRIAQRLVATARSDGRSGSVWTDSNNAPSLRQTLYAVATLAALGE